MCNRLLVSKHGYFFFFSSFLLRAKQACNQMQFIYIYIEKRYNQHGSWQKFLPSYETKPPSWLVWKDGWNLDQSQERRSEWAALGCFFSSVSLKSICGSSHKKGKCRYFFFVFCCWSQRARGEDHTTNQTCVLVDPIPSNKNIIIVVVKIIQPCLLWTVLKACWWSCTWSRKPEV